MPRTYFVYVLASETHELYIGVTNNLERRLAEHSSGYSPKSYSLLHGTTRLVHFESTPNALAAIRREKQLKRWSRRRKLELIENQNPGGVTSPTMGCETWSWPPPSLCSVRVTLFRPFRPFRPFRLLRPREGPAPAPATPFLP